MNRSANQRVIFRWLFFAIGLFIVVRGDLVLDSAQQFATNYLGNPHVYNALLIAGLSPFLASSILLISSLGMKGRSSWPRWLAFGAFLLMLPAFPWFTLVGIFGAILTAAVPMNANPAARESVEPASNDYWEGARKSKAQKFILFLFGPVLIFGVDGSAWLAARIGLPTWEMSWTWWLWLFPLLLINTAIHELGHAFCAWALQHELKLLSVGLLTVNQGRYGRTVQVNWSRLLETGGYMGSIPTIKSHVRLQLLCVVASGPATSLTVGVLSLAIFLNLPGTRWESYWELVATNGVIAFAYVLIGIVPFGYTDGSMLFHLLLRTEPGKSLVDHSSAAQAEIQAQRLLGQADFKNLLQFRDEQLSFRELQGGEGSSLLALSHQQAGYARTVIGDWPAAEDHFRRCLSMQAECAALPAMSANAWTLLHLAAISRHNVVEAERVYPHALTALQAVSEQRDDIGLAINRAMLAELYNRVGKWADSISFATEGLEALPGGDLRLPLRVGLLSSKAYAEILSSLVEQGTRSAREAIDIVRSGQIHGSELNLTWSRIGELGQRMWRAGETEFAIAALNEASNHLAVAGAELAADKLRIELARVFRSLGRYEDAETLLEPSLSGGQAVILRDGLHEHARLQLAGGRMEEAISDCQQLLTMWKGINGAESSVVKSLWARACLNTGDMISAQRLCDEAKPELDIQRHIESVPLRVTLLLSGIHGTGHDPVSWSNELIAKIEIDPLLTELEKRRLMTEEAAVLRCFGFNREADILSEGVQVREASRIHN